MYHCILFDLDGTLVDSEALNIQAFLDLLPDLPFSLAELTERFRGRKMAEIIAEVQTMVGRDLPPDFEVTLRAQAEANFKASLLAYDGVHGALENLDLPICIASNGPQPKIRSILAKTDLARFFDERIYSAYDIGKWKPDPGLLLHAASQMGVAPERCIVVEDSPVGVEAVFAAAMTPLQFCHQTTPIAGAAHFSDYAEFAGKIAALRAGG